MFSFIVCLLELIYVYLCESQQAKPNILFILVDDLGWNDISYHNGSDFQTPNIDNLALSGLRLNNYYIQHICSPTRSALMSGRYPIHTGLQHSVIMPTSPTAIPLSDTLLPHDLKLAGYTTHMMGKWNCGFFNEHYVPTSRGFDTYFGYYNAYEDYYYHNLSSNGDHGYDFRNGTDKTFRNGIYSTYLYGNATMNLFTNYAYNTDKNKKPMFIYLALQSVHAAGGNWKLQAPQNVIDSFDYILDEDRRNKSAMITVMDVMIGDLINGIKALNLWHNLLLIFSTDNGGPTWFGGNNYPLRGAKSTLFEGGVKGVGFVNGGYLNESRRGDISNQMMHCVDWYPTLTDIAGIKPSNLSLLDGYSMLNIIQNKNEISQRTQILHNIDPIGCNLTICGGIRMNEWKLVVGHEVMQKSPCNKKVTTIWCPLKDINENITSIKCGYPAPPNVNYSAAPYNGKPALYNLANDPCEYFDVKNENNDIYQKLYNRLLYYNASMITPQQNLYPDDPKGANPNHFDGFWTPWLNYTHNETQTIFVNHLV